MKNKNTLLKTVSVIITCFIISFSTKAQTSDSISTSPFKVTADLVSSYVWRGVPCPGMHTVGNNSFFSLAPNFQPTLAFTKGHLEIGAWGSTDFQGGYKEVDLYASYVAGPLKFTLTDYDWNFGTRYFNYKSKETGHIFEGSVGYTGPESFPMSVSANVMFAGADKKWNKALGIQDPGKQAYSTYVEFGYAFKYFSPFLGVTPSDGYYGDGYGGVKGFGIVNLGITSTKALKISDSFSLPLKATFGVNPQKEDIYLVFGITL